MPKSKPTTKPKPKSKTVSKPKKKVEKVRKIKKIKKIIARDWHLFDLSKEPLGRVATKIAKVLMGKHKVNYTPHIDQGDFAVVINADKTILTGRKAEQKEYYHHTNYPGGLRKKTYRELKEQNPQEIIRKAVYGMMPDNTLRVKRMKRLKVFKDEKHTYDKKF